MDGPVQVTKTLRLHEAEARFVRMVGDGTPENTKLLDPKGEPIPESVTRVELSLEAGRCARGLFTYYDSELAALSDEERFDSFEAWVLFEPPVGASVPATAFEELRAAHNELVGDFNDLAERYNRQAEAVEAAAFALRAGGAQADTPPCGDAAGCTVPGPGASELVQITDNGCACSEHGPCPEHGGMPDGPA